MLRIKYYKIATIDLCKGRFFLVDVYAEKADGGTRYDKPGA